MVRCIYEVSIEITPTHGAEFPSDCTGAFVFCYVPAGDIRESIDRAEEYLESELYRVLDVDRSIRIEFEDYEPQDEDHPSMNELREALADDDVLTGPYLCYEADDEA
jgi:hypothetical protein